jgi:predicted flap endonuclease-1-like 5' DNA nuclease
MTETGWIVLLVVALAIVVAISFIVARRRATQGDAAAAITAAPVAIVPEMTVAQAAVPESVVPDVPVEVAPAPSPVLASVSPPVSAPPPPPEGADGDNLLRLKGVGPKIAALLQAEGITRYTQIAAWTAADIAAIDAKLGSFSGRPVRDNWVDQARLLAAGDVAGYEAAYGKL